LLSMARKGEEKETNLLFGKKKGTKVLKEVQFKGKKKRGKGQRC